MNAKSVGVAVTQYAQPARTNSETSKLPQHNFAQAEAGKRTAARFNRQAALSLLSCANNLIFYASIAGLGEHTANMVAILHLSEPKSIHSIPSATGEIARLVCAGMREAGIRFETEFIESRNDGCGNR